MNAISTNLFPPIKGTAPRVEWKSVEELKIDEGYQRLITGKASKRLIKGIAENFDWRLLSPLTVSDRDGSYGDPGLFVIDGQHRQAAAILRGDIPTLPCIISRFESYEAEALAFVNINSARRQVTALDRYHARVAAREPEALAIKEVVELLCLSVTRHNDAEFWAPDEIAFPDLVGRHLAREGEEKGDTETALGFLAAWSTKPLLQGRELFEGLIHIARAEWPGGHDGFYEQFIEHLASLRQSTWVAHRNRIMGEDETLKAGKAMAMAFLENFPGDKPKLEKKTIDQKRHDVPKPGGGKTLAIDHRSLESGTTLFPTTLTDPAQETCVLKSGHNNSKIGSEVEKGIWKGMPIHTLTLEERKTCPSECQMLRECYGNNMQWAQRFRHGPALEKKIQEELQDLQAAHPSGFVIRLHVLGDFYSMEYVKFWERMLTMFSGLRIYGYTAHDVTKPIGSKLLTMAVENWERFAMRFSASGMNEISALVVKSPDEVPHNAFLCLAESGKASCCAACTACWESEKNVAFLRRGK